MQTLKNSIKKALGFDDEKDCVSTYEVSSVVQDDDDAPTMTEYGWCFVKPIGDDDDKLGVSIDGLSSLTQHFGNIVSLIGLPGVGKSTLSSSIYNVMRNDKHEYFERSATEAQGCTRGIWSLNEKTKVIKNKYDKIDILDLEGLEDEDVIHYMVVVAMTLSNAILLCKDSSNPRIRWDAFKTLETGVKLFQQIGISLPMPVIYVQVPHGIDTIKVKRKTYKIEQLPDIVKEKYKTLQDIEVRPFSLPKFDNDNRFDTNYCLSVSKLIKELSTISQGPNIKTRIQYAKQVIGALNSNSPQMVSDMNFKLLKNQIEKNNNTECTIAKGTIMKTYKLITLTKSLSYEEFICKCDKFKNGYYNLQTQLYKQALEIPYYNKNDNKHKLLIEQEIKNNNKLIIDARLYCKNIYESELVHLQSIHAAKGNKIMETIDDAFVATMTLKITNYKSKIKFKGYTGLPYQLQYDFINEQEQSRFKLIEQTKELDSFKYDDKSFLQFDLKGKWKTEMDLLENDWQSRVAKAISEGKQVRTTGNHICPNPTCGKDHIPGVGHSKCGKGAVWLWVDGQTKWCVCDTCHAEQSITSVCCWTCKTTLKAEIIPIR